MERGTVDQTKRESINFALTIGLGGAFIIVMYFRLPLFYSIFLFVILLVFITPISYYVLRFYLVGNAEQTEAYRKRVPPGSRHKEYIDQDELEEVVAAITCPVCDADINPSSTESTGIYHCEFCGANVKLPDWTR
jgi:hypothetical protein